MEAEKAKTIAEYAIRKWFIEQNFAMEYFELVVDGNVGVPTDRRKNPAAGRYLCLQMLSGIQTPI